MMPVTKLYHKLCSLRGQSIVEVTLITPLLLVALYIPVDFGVAFFVANITSTAARDGARIGSVNKKSGTTSKGGVVVDRDYTSADATVVRDAVVANLPAYLTNRSVRVRFFENTPANCLEFIEVTASGDYNFFFYRMIRLFGGTVTNPVTISRTAQMPYRNQPSTNNSKCTGTTVDETYSNV